MVDASRRRHDDVVGPVAPAVEGRERAPGDGGDHLRRAEDGAPERVASEDRVRDKVEDQLLRRVLDHGDLLEDHLPFRVDVGEGRGEDHVGHDVERGLEVLVEDARVHDGVVAGRRRVQLAAERVEDLRHLERRVGGRALEEQVLEEVADAGVRIVLVARPRSDPEADRHRPHGGERLRDDPGAAVERRQQVVLHARIVRLWSLSQNQDQGRRAALLVPRAASSVAPVTSGYKRSLRSCLGTTITPRRRGVILKRALRPA